MVSGRITDSLVDLLPNFQDSSKALDSSLRRHTALIKRIRQSIGLDNRDQILKDLETLTLEKYIEEIAGAVPEGIARCKLEKDAWSATEVRHPNGHRSPYSIPMHIYARPRSSRPSIGVFQPVLHPHWSPLSVAHLRHRTRLRSPRWCLNNGRKKRRCVSRGSGRSYASAQNLH